MPILDAWARAVPLLDADGNPQTVDPAAGHSDIPILVETNAAAIEDALVPFGVRIAQVPISPHKLVELINRGKQL